MCFVEWPCRLCGHSSITSLFQGSSVQLLPFTYIFVFAIPFHFLSTYVNNLIATWLSLSYPCCCMNNFVIILYFHKTYNLGILLTFELRIKNFIYSFLMPSPQLCGHEVTCALCWYSKIEGTTEMIWVVHTYSLDSSQLFNTHARKTSVGKLNGIMVIPARPHGALTTTLMRN